MNTHILVQYAIWHRASAPNGITTFIQCCAIAAVAAAVAAEGIHWNVIEVWVLLKQNTEHRTYEQIALEGFFFVGLSHRRVAANRPSISFHYTKWTRYSHSRITHSGTMWHGAGSSTHLTLQSIESHMCVLTMHFYDQHTDPFTWPISGKNCFRSIVFFVVVFFVLMSVKALSVAYNVCFSYLHTECVHRVCWVRMEILHPFSMHVHAFGIFHAVAYFISFHSFHCRQSTHTSSSSFFILVGRCCCTL